MTAPRYRTAPLPQEPQGDVYVDLVDPDTGGTHQSYWRLPAGGWVQGVVPEQVDEDVAAEAISWGQLVGRILDQGMEMAIRPMGTTS